MKRIGRALGLSTLLILVCPAASAAPATYAGPDGEAGKKLDEIMSTFTMKPSLPIAPLPFHLVYRGSSVASRPVTRTFQIICGLRERLI